jgi:ABC-type antimicrobial peptide transport system permease subunit
LSAQVPLFLTVRWVHVDAAAVLQATAALRRQLHLLDPELPLLRLLPLTEFTGRNFTLWMVRLGAVMFGVFGVIALCLAAIGVYGVKSHAVARRTREIGIRMALGADRVAVLRLIMRQGILQTGCAVGAGLILCLFAGRALATIFFQVDPLDPLILLLATGLLAGATLLACWIPARRALRVDPLVALRAD